MKSLERPEKSALAAIPEAASVVVTTPDPDPVAAHGREAPDGPFIVLERHGAWSERGRLCVPGHDAAGPFVAMVDYGDWQRIVSHHGGDRERSLGHIGRLLADRGCWRTVDGRRALVLPE